LPHSGFAFVRNDKFQTALHNLSLRSQCAHWLWQSVSLPPRPQAHRPKGPVIARISDRRCRWQKKAGWNFRSRTVCTNEVKGKQYSRQGVQGEATWESVSLPPRPQAHRPKGPVIPRSEATWESVLPLLRTKILYRAPKSGMLICNLMAIAHLKGAVL